MTRDSADHGGPQDREYERLRSARDDQSREQARSWGNGRGDREAPGADRSGAWGPGTKLPREADLAAELGLSRGLGDRDALELARDEHLRIYEAIVDSNPELARAATAMHIATNEQWLREHLAPDQGVQIESRDP
jgi:hypothetical protein